MEGSLVSDLSHGWNDWSVASLLCGMWVKKMHGLVIAIDSWIHLLLIHVYFSWTTGTWKFYFYFTGYCFSWTRCVFIGSSICTWKIRTHQYLLLISLVPWCILLKEFINLYHEQNLCLCVLHMVYHGVEESTTPCYSGTKYILWAKNYVYVFFICCTIG